MPFRLPPLYPILDESYFPSDPAERARYLDSTVRALAGAGVSLLQLRMKTAARGEILRAAAAAREAAGTSMRLILNDHVALVAACGFDGVHLGQDDAAIDEARRLLGPAAILGLSTHTAAQALAADNTAADYVAAGPVFATASKPDAEQPIGPPGVQAARKATAKPLVAIGGITLANVQAVWGAGADSVALIGALFGGDARCDASAAARLAGDFLKLFR